MDIFNSPWLLNMLAKSSKTPQGRILSLFDILGDWLNAPNVDLEISQESLSNQALIAFCTTQAKAFGAASPTILAEHIVLIARNAAQQEIENPGCNSLMHAKKAAQALITAQSQREWPNSKPAIFSIAASLIVLICASALWLPTLIENYHPQTLLAKTNNIKLIAKSNAITNNNLTAHDAVVMYAKYEQMRNGTCQFPEAIQIPDKHKAIYLENVVGGKLPTDLNDLAIANFYLEKVRCNFTPMLMAKSK